jgi:hypothetical protein
VLSFTDKSQKQESKMPKLTLIIAIAVVFVASSQLAFARKAGGDPKTAGKPYLKSQSTAQNKTGGAGTGKVKVKELTIKKTTDKSSPQ